MRENLQNGLVALRRKLGPMKAVILMELFAALALVLYINGVFSSGSKAEVGGMLLMGFVLTFLQPKTQFGLVWTWQDKIRELSTAPLEDMGEGIEDLRVQRQDGPGSAPDFCDGFPVIFAAGAGHIRDSFLLAQCSVRGAVLSDLRGLAAWIPGRTGSSAL